MNARIPILVTGAPRTGTTLVGTILGLPRRVGVIFEPLHPDVGVEGRGWNRLPADDSRSDEPLRVEFPFVTSGHPFATPFHGLMNDVLAGCAAYRRPGYAGRLGWLSACARRVFTSRLALHNRWVTAWPLHRRWLVKDPHLCLAAEYAHGVMGMACLVTIRHPAATAESWVRLGWNPDLRQFWRQPLLWERHLQEFARPDPSRLSPLEKAAHAWLWINKVLLDYRKRNPGMVFVRLEDLAAAPVDQFRALYGQFALPFDARIEQAVLSHTTTGSRAVGRPGRPHRIKRDSQSVVDAWQLRLSRNEQRIVRKIVGDTGATYYPDSAW